MVANIPGNNVAAGDEIHDYIPNFTFDEVVGPNGELLDELDVVSRPLKDQLVLVFKQPGRINIQPRTKGCDPGILGRILNNQEIQKEYNLEGPVAGTFFRVQYDYEGWAEYYLCYFASCTGIPIPGIIKGVNDNVKPDASTCKKPFRFQNRWWHPRFLHYTKK
jgi:hypothetical protein